MQISCNFDAVLMQRQDKSGHVIIFTKGRADSSAIRDERMIRMDFKDDSRTRKASSLTSKMANAETKKDAAQVRQKMEEELKILMKPNDTIASLNSELKEEIDLSEEHLRQLRVRNIMLELISNYQKEQEKMAKVIEDAAYTIARLEKQTRDYQSQSKLNDSVVRKIVQEELIRFSPAKLWQSIEENIHLTMKEMTDAMKSSFAEQVHHNELQINLLVALVVADIVLQFIF